MALQETDASCKPFDLQYRFQHGFWQIMTVLSVRLDSTATNCQSIQLSMSSIFCRSFYKPCDLCPPVGLNTKPFGSHNSPKWTYLCIHYHHLLTMAQEQYNAGFICGTLLSSFLMPTCLQTMHICMVCSSTKTENREITKWHHQPRRKQLPTTKQQIVCQKGPERP